ncbi:MAG: hypothetical protein AVDCRST_MAG12-724, partial [uncultured Rubrobacteraceae bacterium]
AGAGGTVPRHRRLHVHEHAGRALCHRPAPGPPAGLLRLAVL